MKIGLSLSLCVKDIIDGKVDIKDVKFLSTGTRCDSLEDWELVVDGYQEFYWEANPEKAAEVAWYFINNGLIIQPRLEGKHPVARGLSGGRWQQHWIDESEYNRIDRAVNELG